MSDTEVETQPATQADATAPQPPLATEISTVALKLPPFWFADPQVWFAQVESQFVTRRITNQDTKFHHIVASLPPEVAVDIRDLIINKPPHNAYDELKAKLITRTTVSQAKRLQQLLSAEELGDRKPSQLLRKFEQLLDTTSSDHPLIRELFLQRLPIHVRQLLAATTTDATPLNELAQQADRLMDVPAQNISTIPQQHEPHGFAALQAQLQEITQTMAAFTKRQNQSTAKKPPEEPNNDPPTLCWYHRRFGYKARKCTCSGNGMVSK
jgi:hypothetical protein